MTGSRPASLLTTALVLVLALAACRPTETKPTGTAPAIAVNAVAAERGDITSALSYSGAVSPTWTVAVTSKVSGPIVELHAEAGRAVAGGEVLAVIDHRALDDQVAQARANLRAAEARLSTLLAGGRTEDVAAAEAGAAAADSQVSGAAANLAAAKERLAAANAGGRAEVVAQAQAKLDADRAALDKLLNGPTQFDKRNAELALMAAKDRLYQDQTLYDYQQARGQVSNEQRRAALIADQLAIEQAQLALDKLLAPPRAEDVAAARALVAADEQALTLAQQPSRPEEIAQLEQAVAAAQAQLDAAGQQSAAQRALADKASKPYTAQDIAQARAAVDVARAALQASETVVADATITAPADGILSDVPVALGSLVGPQVPIATLLSPDLEVLVSVEESQVLLFQEGQDATITVASASPMSGIVTLIAPAADPRTRKFSVKVRPTQTGILRSGMSAVVNIEIGQQLGAVLIPREVVIQRNGKDIVFVDDNGRARQREVRTGLGDGLHLPVLSGIAPGEMVIIPSSVDLSDGDAVRRVGN
jgi:HlyD family secretion protein